MNKRVFSLVLFVVLLSFALLSHQFAVVRASVPRTARLSPNPPVYIAEHTGEIFSVALNVSEVENLHSAYFLLAYDSVLLNVHQVTKGAFFPYDAYFYFEVSEPLGLIELNMSLTSSHEPLSGGGILAELSFNVDQAPFESVGSPVQFLQSQLFNPDLEEVECKSVSAIFFWQSAQPSTPDGTRHIDLYTLKGGIGLGEFGGVFRCGSLVTLKVNVTYEDWPQQNLLVAFQVLNPQNETVLVFVTETDENGTAGTSFRVPETLENAGLWTAIASVDIACEIVWDTLTFRVSPCVGGETTAIAQYLEREIYFAIVGILVAGLIVSKRVFGGSRKHVFSASSHPSLVQAQDILFGYGDCIWGLT